MKREVPFRMERPDLLHEGDQVNLIESKLVTLSGTVIDVKLLQP